MSAAPDPADLAPSRDPAAYGKRPLFTAGFFAWVSLCVICILAGVAIGRSGLMNGAPAPAPPAQDVSRTAPAAPSLAAAPAAQGAGEADATLSNRVARLETSSSRVGDAAAAALAASALADAAQGSAPFDQDLAAYLRLSPTDPDLLALAPLAARGAPSRAALAEALPDLASEAAAAARQPAKGAGYLARLWAAIGKVVVVRRLDPNAPGVDGALARAQSEAAAGDLAAAVHTLDALPPTARAPLADWMAAAARRLEIDRRIEALRARALGDLAQPPPSPQAAPQP